MTSNARKLRLKVGDAALSDVGEGRARISRHLMDALDLAEGEFLRVHGTHAILVTVAPSSPADEGLDIVRLSASERRRAGVNIGDIVEAERHEVPAAMYVRLVMLGHSGSTELTSEDLRPELAAQPIMVGDTVSVAPRRSVFDAQVSVLGLTVAEVAGSSTQCGALLARVVETKPSGVVMVSDSTTIHLETGGSPAEDPSEAFAE